jgi:glutathione peroxidase
VVAVASLVVVAVLAGCPAKPAANGGGVPVGGTPVQREVVPPAVADEPATPARAPTASAAEELPVEPVAPADPRYALDFTMNRIEGQAEPLAAYRGKVVMVVNVASACGLTPQYEGLQALYESKGGGGLVILGFPANNFGDQEPGTNEQIQEFCTGEYHVSFPMFEKISVLGDDQHPLYQRLSQEGGPPTWNFTKYLVDRAGRVVARFDPRTRPDDPALVAKIDELLSE